MKNIYKILGVLFLMGVVLTSCSNDSEPFQTISENDFPVILDPTLPDRINGELPTLPAINRDKDFQMKVVVTPSDFIKVNWEIDDCLVAEGTSVTIPLEAGKYYLKITAITTLGKSTSREAYILVNSLENDPVAITLGSERIVSKNSIAKIYGTNIEDVKSIIITPKNSFLSLEEKNEKECSVMLSSDATFIEYKVPSDVENGEYRVSFVDSQGKRYGAGTINITNTTLVIDGYERATKGALWTMSGLNMNEIATIKLGDITISDFYEQTENILSFVCPDIEDGNYIMQGTNKDNTNVQFYSDGKIVNEVKSTISSEVVLWEGHHYVSWDKPDGDVNKQFNLIPQETLYTLNEGSTISVYYSVNPDDSYHKLQTVTAWWTMLPGTSEIEFSENGVYNVLITEKVIDLLKEQGGFMCVGHGYYVDKVTVK